jgi:hypothetical protein
MRSKFVARLSAILLAVCLAAALLGGAASAGSSATLVAAPAAARQPPTLAPAPARTAAPAALEAAADDPRLQTEPFIRTELFFGSERPNKPEVSDSEFKQFLDEEVTPRFPDGLTVLKGFGQFRESSGEIVQESSFVLILLYPRETLRDSSAKIEAIRARYTACFEQESVLRVDDPRPVRVSFERSWAATVTEDGGRGYHARLPYR